MSLAIRISDETLTTESVNEAINESVDEYSRTRRVSKRDINLNELREAVFEISKEKMKADLNVAFNVNSDGTDFTISVIYPELYDDFVNYANSANPHVTFSNDGNYFTKRSKGADSLRVNENLLPFLNTLVRGYVKSATFIAVSSIGLRS